MGDHKASLEYDGKTFQSTEGEHKRCNQLEDDLSLVQTHSFSSRTGMTQLYIRRKQWTSEDTFLVCIGRTSTPEETVKDKEVLEEAIEGGAVALSFENILKTECASESDD